MRRLQNGPWIAERIRRGAPETIRLTAAASQAPGMISAAERRLLAYLGEHAFRPGTCVVDAGCFLGASTRALLDGLAHHPGCSGRVPAGVVHSYDLFQADAYMIEAFLSGTGLRPGDSFEPCFRQRLGPDLDRVTVHAGDLRASPWTGPPLSIVFLDVLWSWDLNAFAMANFYRYLLADDSFVVHQDYVYAWYPWIPVTMEHFSAHFELVAYVPLATVVFRTVRPLSADDAAIDLLRDLAPETLLGLMERAVGRFSGETRGILECSEASLLRYLGRKEQARERLHAVLEQYRELEAPPRFAREILAHIESGAEPRRV